MINTPFQGAKSKTNAPKTGAKIGAIPLTKDNKEKNFVISSPE